MLDREVVWTLGFQRDEEDGRLEIGMGGAAFVTRGLGGHDRGEVVW